MDLSRIIAGNLKKLRLERNLSLGQLSESSGVSKVMLAQIEKAESNPTINTLWKIAKGLKVPYTVLIDEPIDDTVVLHKNNAKSQSNDDNSYRVYCYYNTNPKRNFEMFEVELDPGVVYESYGHSEKSEEYILVTSGTLKLSTDHKEYILHEEDSIRFLSANVHTYENVGNEMVRAVMVNYYQI